MTQGTTPTLTFTLPIDVSGATYLNLAFEQNGTKVLEKDMSDLTVSETVVTIKLTEAETLALSVGSLAMQIRAKVGNNYFASNIAKTTVYRAINKEALD